MSRPKAESTKTSPKILERARLWYLANREEVLEKKKIYRKNNREKLADHFRKWVKKHPKKVSAWRLRHQEKKRFGRPRKEILELYRYTCQTCGDVKGSQLHIHHIDESGQNKKPNNKLDNLTVLCCACHLRLHNPRIKKHGR